MKKHLALLSAMLLLITGCAKTESSVPTEISSPTSQSTDSSQTISESAADSAADLPEFSEPLFRESSLYFEYAESENALDNFALAASAKSPRSAEQLGLNSAEKSGAAGDTKYEYTINGVTANAFVYFRSEEDIRVLIDPAYMYNIPLPDLEAVPAESYVFNINGTDIICDSLFVSAKSAIQCDEAAEISEYYTDDYCYAAITMDVSVTASSEGIAAAGKLKSMDKLTDAETALEVNLLGSGAFDKKSDAAAQTYNALLSAKEQLLADDIMGVNLIDLDFDGKPEVLVSRSANEDKEYGWCEYTDADIYSVESGGLVYIDTLYNNDSGLLSEHGNVIGLKTLENGEKAWFTMSRFKRDDKTSKPADYLFTLKDGKLEFTEVFSCSDAGAVNFEGDIEGTHYYMNGEELQFGVYYDYEPYYTPGDPEWEDAKPDWSYYTYGDYTAPFGKWEIYGWLRRDFCKDIEQTFLLYSDEFSANKGNSTYEKLPVTERMIDYKLANLTDAYYFGDYDPTLQNYYYEFLGGYAKPVIYLYPEEATDVSVKVDLDGELTCAYPDYRDGWNVTAYPDGTLADKATGKEYYCLYWEGESVTEWDMSKGEVVSGSSTAQFLDEKLTEIGLNPRERNEFIIYWLPRLQENEFNYITFQTEAYSAAVPLEVTPKPDSVLRVFMVFAAVPGYFESEPQHFGGFERNGFTLVEWGGGEAVISE